MTRLFVYGTLRRGGRAEITRLCAAIYKGSAHARGILFRVGDYPGMVDSANESHHVAGELFELPQPAIAWPVLDAYEGAEFERRVVDVRPADGGILQAWAYFYRFDTSQNVRIISGDYFSEV